MTERMNFFRDGDIHPDDCDCNCGRNYDGKVHGVKVHGGVCHIANVGTWVPERELEKRLHPDWKRQAELGTKSYHQLVNEFRARSLTARLEELRYRMSSQFAQSSEEHKEELRRLSCRPWCRWFDVDYKHSWCEPKWNPEDYEKSQNAVEGRYRRAQELIDQNRPGEMLCCFGTHIECTCKDFYPGRDPACPLKEEHERTDKRYERMDRR